MSEKLNKIIICCLLVTLVGAGVLYVVESDKRLRYEAMLDGLYNKSFFDMVGNLRNIETNLSKAQIANSSGRRKHYYTLISRHAEQAEANLGQLPLHHSVINKTMKYVNQLGDYARYLSDQDEVDEKAQQSITKLKGVCSTLNKELNVLSARIAEGHNCFTAESNVISPELQANTIGGSMVRISETAIEYPKLIYDGPFSENSIRVKPKQDFREVSEVQAAQKMQRLFGCTVSKQEDLSTAEKSYIFKLKGSDATVRVSQLGGFISWMGNSRSPQDKKKTLEQCRDIAREFVFRAYSPDMEVVWAQELDNVALINLTTRVGDVVAYPDMVKVQVAMDNGEILGVEGNSFITNNHKREITLPAISIEKAKKAVNSRLDIRVSRQAIIPTESGEKLCYEFQGYYENELFIVYINAQTGEEEEVFVVIDSAGVQLVV